MFIIDVLFYTLIDGGRVSISSIMETFGCFMLEVEEWRGSSWILV